MMNLVTPKKNCQCDQCLLSEDDTGLVDMHKSDVSSHSINAIL